MVYKKAIYLIVAFLLFLVLGSRVQAQDSQEDCDSEAVREWLVQRQMWWNATNDVGSAASDLTPDEIQMYLFDHLQHIEDLPRPGCADVALVNTYYFYNQFQHMVACVEQTDFDCIDRVENRLDGFAERFTNSELPLHMQAGFVLEDNLDIRPEGWDFQVSDQDNPTSSSPLSVGGDSSASPSINVAGCSSSTTCSEMSSCAEAYACLKAGSTQLDRDNDGIPCESICGE